MIVNFRFDTAQTERAFDRLKTQGPKAIARALNKSILSARTAMVSVVRADMGALKAGDARAAIAVTNATPDRPLARLSASNARIPLVDFGAKGPEPTRGRGRLSADTGRGRQVYPHAFLVTFKNGHRGVFKRAGPGRLLSKELRGPSVAQVFLNHVDVGIARGEEQLLKNLQSEFRFALSQPL